MRYGDGPAPTATIAARQGIPEPYLERLMSTLNKAGFVHSRRGPQGGHLLARPPYRINLYDIMQELDGNASPLKCLSLPTDCMFADCCAQQEIWHSVEETIRQALESHHPGPPGGTPERPHHPPRRSARSRRLNPGPRPPGRPATAGRTAASHACGPENARRRPPQSVALRPLPGFHHRPRQREQRDPKSPKPKIP